jgi:hypothetical protein
VSGNDKCQGCGHTWGAHTGRNGGEHCNYRPWADYQCPCKIKNPEIAAEDRMAGAMWRMWTAK